MIAPALKYLSIIFISLIVSTSASANSPLVLFEAVPEWVNVVNTEPDSEDKPEGSVKYLLFDNQIDIRTVDKTNFFHYTTKPINEQGLTNVSQVEVSFSPEYEKLVFHEIKVVRNGKIINKLDKNKLKLFQQEEELQNNLYNESWEALFILEDIRVNDIIDYSYSIVGTNPVLGSNNFGSSPLSWSVPVETINFRLLSTNDNPLTIRIHNSEEIVVKTESLDTVEYSLKLDKVKAIRMDDYAPTWYTHYSYLTYTEYDNWSNVNDWARELYSQHVELPSELVKILDDKITSSRTQSVANIAQWVQDNIRYFGIELGVNSHKPSLPSDTFERRYGDCKDKAVLLIAILKHYNIEAFPVLVSTTTSKMLPDELPSPGAFNHVIVTFNIDNKDYWLDATMTNQRGNLDDMSFPNYYWGLVVKNNTTNLSPITALSEKQLRGKVNVRQQLALGYADIKNELTITTKYTGWQAEQFRTYIDEVGVKVSSQDHLDYLSKYFPAAIEKEIMLISSSKEGNSISTTESYYIDNMVDKQNNHLFVHGNQIIDNVWLPSIRQRTAPFTLPYFLDINIETNVTANKPGDIIWFGESEETSSKWFSYTRDIQKKENVLSIKYEYHSLMPEVSADEFGQYAMLLENIENSLNFSLKLRKEQSNAESSTRAKNLVKMLMDKKK